MTETFQWPPDGTTVEAIDCEQGVVVPLMPQKEPATVAPTEPAVTPPGPAVRQPNQNP